MHYLPKNGIEEQYGIDLISKIKFSKNGKNLSERYLFKFNSEKILLKEFLEKEIKISRPKLIISLNCELKQIDGKSNNRLNILKENIERLISNNETWIIGAGLNVGVHKMIGKIVRNMKILENNGFHTLIGINAWRNIVDNENINSNLIEYVVNTNFTPERFSLNSNYDILFFMDENQYEKEISFYNLFDNVLKDYDAFSLQIVYGGDKMNLERAYNFLKNSNLLVVIKDSGGIADLISTKMDSNVTLFEEAISKFNFNKFDFQLVNKWILDMYNTYKNEIIIFDLRNKVSKLDESLFLALLERKINRENIFIYSSLFNEDVINKFDIPEITDIKELKPIVKKFLFSKKLKLIKLILSNIKNIDKYFNYEDLADLYQESCRMNTDNRDELHKKYLEYFKKHQNVSRQTPTIENNDIQMENMSNEDNKFVNGTKLFLWSIDSELFETARIIFEFSREYLATSLHGIINLKSKSKIYKNEGCEQLSHKYLEESLYYENIYKEILNEIYDKYYLKSIKSLRKPQVDHGSQSILQIIIKENVKEICNTKACEIFLQKACEHDDVLSLDEQKKNENSTLQMRRYGPKVKYYIHLISYLIFLLLFMYFNLVELKTFDIKQIRSVVIESLIYSFVIGFIIEDIEQILNERSKKSRKSWKIYETCLRNKYHICTLICSVICFIIRYSIPNKWFVIVRCYYALLLSLFILKMLLFCFYFESIGSKVIMIQKMIKDLRFFLVIFIIFIVAYGTLLQTLQDSNRELSGYRLTRIFYTPYFQFYGELMLDSFKTDPENCNTFDCNLRHFTSVMGLAVFLLLTTILLLNLLIAMFNYTFQMDIKDINSFLRLQLFQNYQFKSYFPSPLNIITLPYWIYNFMLSNDNSMDYLLGNFDENEMKEISVVENWCAKTVFEKMHLQPNEKLINN